LLRQIRKNGTTPGLACIVLSEAGMTSKIDLLLVHSDDHLPVLARGLEVGAAFERPLPPPLPPPDWLWSESGHANDLPRQRWCVIAPVGDAGDRLLELAAPLMARRSEQQGAPAAVYRVPAHLSLDEAARWKKRYLRPETGLDTDASRYQLVLGDLDQVPASIQTVLATDGFVGRLAFDRDDDYRAYVHKVLAWEERPSSAFLGDAILHTVHDGTAANASGYQGILEPGCRLLRERRNLGEVQARDVREVGSRTRPHPEDLWAAADSDRPRVMLTLAQGEGAPRPGWRSAARQRRYQGAVSFGNGLRLTADDVELRAFLPGGVWFSLACFGAGTPAVSAYQPWLDELARLGHVGRDLGRVRDSLALGRPFVAALPKALLANPHGPLAFIGHVDLAWSYSFTDIDDRPGHHRPGRFVEVIKSLLMRDRVGVALRSLSRFLGEVNTELTALDERDHAPSTRDRVRRAHLWMLRQDLAGYALLGDPAVRLPLASEERLATPAAVSSLATTLDLLHGAPPADRTPAPAPVLPRPPAPSIEGLERAIGKVLSGSAVVLVAREHGLTLQDLERCVERYRAAGRAALRDG
jgi:hypothetical protein